MKKLVFADGGVFQVAAEPKSTVCNSSSDHTGSPCPCKCTEFDPATVGRFLRRSRPKRSGSRN